MESLFRHHICFLVEKWSIFFVFSFEILAEETLKCPQFIEDPPE